MTAYFEDEKIPERRYTEQEMYAELRGYGYTDKEIDEIEQKYGNSQLIAILVASDEWALKPTDSKWKEWDIDRKYPLYKTTSFNRRKDSILQTLRGRNRVSVSKTTGEQRGRY